MPEVSSDPKLCAVPGCTNIRQYKSKTTRSKKCEGCNGAASTGKRYQYDGARQSRKKRAILARNRERAFIYLGGKCSNKDCPILHLVLPISAYDYHHRIPSHKTAEISKLIRTSWNRLKVELDKCDLLCCLCHRLHHCEGAATL